MRCCMACVAYCIVCVWLVWIMHTYMDHLTQTFSIIFQFIATPYTIRYIVDENIVYLTSLQSHVIYRMRLLFVSFCCHKQKFLRQTTWSQIKCNRQPIKRLFSFHFIFFFVFLDFWHFHKSLCMKCVLLQAACHVKYVKKNLTFTTFWSGANELIFLPSSSIFSKLFPFFFVFLVWISNFEYFVNHSREL